MPKKRRGNNFFRRKGKKKSAKNRDEIDHRRKSVQHTSKKPRTTQACQSNSVVTSTSKNYLTFVDTDHLENQAMQVPKIEADVDYLQPIEQHYIECKGEPISINTEGWMDQMNSYDKKTIHCLQTTYEGYPSVKINWNSNNLENANQYTAVVCFFQSMADVVATFSPNLIAETQSRIKELVMEMKGRIKEEQASSMDLVESKTKSDELSIVPMNSSTSPEEPSNPMKAGYSDVANSPLNNIFSDLDTKHGQVFSASNITPDSLLLWQDIHIKNEPLEIKAEVEIPPEYENSRRSTETDEPDEGPSLGNYVTFVYRSLKTFFSRTKFKRKLDELVSEIKIFDDMENENS